MGNSAAQHRKVHRDASIHCAAIISASTGRVGNTLLWGHLGDGSTPRSAKCTALSQSETPRTPDRSVGRRSSAFRSRVMADVLGFLSLGFLRLGLAVVRSF
jgi:hypothetical protein